MIQIDDVPKPGVLYTPADFTRWAILDLEMAEVHEDNLKQLAKQQPFSDETLARMDLEANALTRNITSVILFSALEVEATLNFRGVLVFGNEYFDRVVERLRPEEKLASIVATTQRSLIEKTDEIHLVLKRVFAARNKVAHPKTKAFKDWDSATGGKDETIETARQAVVDMKRFLELFSALVPESHHADMRDPQFTDAAT